MITIGSQMMTQIKPSKTRTNATTKQDNDASQAGIKMSLTMFD